VVSRLMTDFLPFPSSSASQLAFPTKRQTQSAAALEHEDSY